jgi:lipopolysaccharide transport system permease protein
VIREPVRTVPAEPDPDNHPLAEFVSDSRTRLSFVAAARELYAFREVIWAFTSRSFRLRYKQTLLGVLWVVLQPLLFLGVFVLIFGRAVEISGGGAPYAAFALSALVPWGFASSSVTFGSNALVADASLLRKVYFPRETPVLGGVASYLPDLLIGFGLILAAAPLTGAEFGPSLFLLPLLVLALVVPVIGLATPLAALSVYYRDFRYIIPFALQIALFASPVAYPVTTIPEQWRNLYALNPVVGPLEGFRQVFALGSAPDWTLLAISGASATFITFLGYVLFKRLERQMADVV